MPKLKLKYLKSKIKAPKALELVFDEIRVRPVKGDNNGKVN